MLEIKWQKKSMTTYSLYLIPWLFIKFLWISLFHKILSFFYYEAMVFETHWENEFCHIKQNLFSLLRGVFLSPVNLFFEQQRYFHIFVSFYLFILCLLLLSKSCLLRCKILTHLQAFWYRLWLSNDGRNIFQSHAFTASANYD